MAVKVPVIQSVHVTVTRCLATRLLCDCPTSGLDINKIAIQGKGPDGKWTKKPLAYRESNFFFYSKDQLKDL